MNNLDHTKLMIHPNESHKIASSSLIKAVTPEKYHNIIKKRKESLIHYRNIDLVYRQPKIWFL